MAKKFDANFDFDGVFAKCSTIEELKQIANETCEQVKKSFENRAAEIKNGVKKPRTRKQAKEEPKKQEAKQENSQKAEEVIIALDDIKSIKKLGLKFEKYNERCWVLRGNTKPIRFGLQERFDCIFNKRLRGGEGWLFRNAEVESCASVLGIKVNVA